MTYDVVPPVKAVPGVIALGEVVVGETYRQSVQFKARSGETTAVEGVETPPGVTAEVGTSAAPGLGLIIRLKEPGVWRDVVKVKIRVGSVGRTLEIPCVAFAKAP